MSKLQQTTLGKVIGTGGGRIQTGPFGSQLHASDYVESGIPCIMPTNMKNNRVNLSGIAFIADKDAQRLSQHLVQEGDIVYSRRGDVTQKALIGKAEVGYFCGTGCLLLRPGNAIDPEFLTYHLSTPTNQSWIVNHAVGATMPNLNTAILAAVPLTLPQDKEAQKKIAAVLSALDAKIDCNNRINAELEAMAKTLYDYWFVQFDFPDANGKPYKSSGGKMDYNAALKRETPEGWEIGNVSELCYLNHRIWPNKDHPDQVSYIDLANVNNGEILGVQNFDWYDAPSRARRILSPGDTIVGTVRPGNRSFALVPNSEEILTGSTGFAVLTPKSAIYREFNYLSLTSESNINRLTTVASGAAYPAVNPEAVAAQSIAIPGKYLVKQFHETTSSLFNLLERHRDQNQQLAQLRDWLLPLLMNGQVTVA